MLHRWIKSFFAPTVKEQAVHLLQAQDAATALRAFGILVTLRQDDWHLWQMGDLLMSDAALIKFAVSRGLMGCKS